MIGVDDARAYVLAACRALPPVALAPAAALGHVLAEPVVARETVPPFVSSSMDGYAVRAADSAAAPARLAVVGELMAGDDPSPLSVGRGQAVRIMTGAALPEGADAVCMVEHTTTDGDEVTVEEALVPGTNVRPAGDDIALGDVVVAARTRLGAAHLAVLASLGVDRVVVHRRPRVGVLSTGNELVTQPGPLPPGKIRDSNRPGLLAQLTLDGFEAVDLGWVPDDEAALGEAIEAGARRCDAVLTSGGVSVGDRDVVKTVFGRLGGERSRWWQVAVRPAKPFAFSVLGGVCLFGLPGNPVSAAVSYELFARPALRLMAGYPSSVLGRPEVEVRCEVDMRRKPDGKLHLVRAVTSRGPGGELQARPSGGQGSHQMVPFAAASALVLLPDGDGAAAGGTLLAWALDPDALAGPAVPS